MANVWFISDLHGGHKNICKFRDQFSSEEYHWNLVKENYHSAVTKRDQVYFLGDVCFTQERLNDLSSWTAEKKILILGNHCTEKIHIRELTKVFDDIHSLFKYKGMWLSHAPLHPDELRGKVNVHGHCHYHQVDDLRYLNVCLEHTEYKPISLESIKAIFNERFK